MGKCIFLRKGSVHKAPIAIKANFAENTWEAIVLACQTNAVPSTWVVGSQKTMKIDGVDYPIDIIGKNHDTYTAGGTAPLTFQMHNCYATKYAMNTTESNVGGWDSCAMRKTHLPSILELMPSEVRAGIREVNKLATGGNNSTAITTSADKLFCLSEFEVFGKNDWSYSGDGKRYAYYTAGNSAKKTLNGTGSIWWLRSPRKQDAWRFCITNASGGNGAAAAHELQGLSFAFCF